MTLTPPPTPAFLGLLTSPYSPPARAHFADPRSPTSPVTAPHFRPVGEAPFFPCIYDPGPIPDLEGPPGRPGAPGSRASSAGSHRRPSPSGNRAGGGAEGLGRSLVLLLPQWPWPCPARTPESQDEGQPPGERRVAPGPPGTCAVAQREAGGGSPTPRQRPRA